MATRIGRRIGGFYVSTAISGRNAGQIRVGHKLPLGFYGSTTINTTDTPRQPAARTRKAPSKAVTTPARSAAPTKAVTSPVHPPAPLKAAGDHTRLISFLVILVSIGITVAFWPVGIPMLILFGLAYLGSFVGKDGKLHARNAG